MKINDMEFSVSIINLEVKVGKLERTLSYLCENNSSLNVPSKSLLEEIEKEAQKEVIDRYPELKISFED